MNMLSSPAGREACHPGRIGTPAVTTRGMGQGEMKQIAGMITRVIKDMKNEGLIASVRKEVTELCERFPLYEGLR